MRNDAPMTPLLRSKLFVPGIRPEFFPKALASAADAISFDLEDAVPEERKAEARELVARALASPEFAATRQVVIVRVNALGTPHFAADLAAVVSPRLDLLNLPKVESPDDIRAAVAALAPIEKSRGLAAPVRLLANIESPLGLRHAAEIARADPRVAGLQLGLGDLFEPLGIDRADAAAVHHVQLAMRLAAGEAGLWALDTGFGAVKDADGYRREATQAKRLGFLGKTCLHPSQVAIANEVFRPSAEEIAQAKRIVEAARDAHAKGLGAFLVDGRMIDPPFLRRAEALAALG
jgi:citrate lyase subunit beta/citryl-CoA lyase